MDTASNTRVVRSVHVCWREKGLTPMHDRCHRGEKRVENELERVFLFLFFSGKRKLVLTFFTASVKLQRVSVSKKQPDGKLLKWK